MINPKTITNYNRTEAQLEEFLLFAIIVAGKKASMQAEKLESFLSEDKTLSPFSLIQKMLNNNVLMENITKHRLGQYKKIYKSFTQILQFQNKLSTISVDDLESIHGIGPKTSRFFLLHSRPNQQYAVLDTHILKYMNAQGYKVPKSTPSKQKYKIVEEQFIKIAETQSLSLADFDLAIWNMYSQK